MERTRRGFRLLGVSWRVVRQDRSLMWLPIVSSVVVLVLTSLIFSPVFFTKLGNGKPSNAKYLWVLFFVVYFVGTVVATIFNAALVAAAAERLAGRRGSATDGIRLAWSQLHRVLAWAMLTATVGLVLRVLQARTGLGKLYGLTWSVVTFLVLPVLVCEHLGPVDAVKRSAELFRQRWGEQLVGEGTIGVAVTIVLGVEFAATITLAAIAGSLAGLAAAVAVLALGLVVFVITAATGTALTGIFNAALYRFAVSGEATGLFSRSDLGGSFRAFNEPSIPQGARNQASDGASYQTHDAGIGLPPRAR